MVATIVSTGSYLPGEPINNAQMEAWVGPLPEDMLEGIQVTSATGWSTPRRASTDQQLGDGDRGGPRRAGQRRDRRDRGRPDRHVTASPDYLLPPLATFVQESLGLERCATTEIRSGCAGFGEALDIARLYVESGQYKTAVVIGSEAISPLLVPVFLGKDPEKIRMRDRMNPYNFGDGAGAVVVRASEDDQGMIGSAMACVGGLKKPGMQIFGGGTAEPIHKQLQAKRLVDLKVDVVESGRFTPYVLTEALVEVLKATGVKAEDLDVCLIPEGNAGYMVEELEAAGLMTDEWRALEGKIVENLALVGATGSAAVPLALDHAWKTGAIKQGDLVMLLAIETSKWKYAGTVLRWTVPNPA